MLEDVNNELKKEKIELNRKSEELENNIFNLYQCTSVLRAKVIDLENEKSSLTTTLRLVPFLRSFTGSEVLKTARARRTRDVFKTEGTVFLIRPGAARK